MIIPFLYIVWVFGSLGLSVAGFIIGFLNLDLLQTSSANVLIFILFNSVRHTFNFLYNTIKKTIPDEEGQVENGQVICLLIFLWGISVIWGVVSLVVMSSHYNKDLYILLIASVAFSMAEILFNLVLLSIMFVYGFIQDIHNQNPVENQA